MAEAQEPVNTTNNQEWDHNKVNKNNYHEDSYGEEEVKEEDSYMRENDEGDSEGRESEFDDGATLKDEDSMMPMSHLELRDAKFAKVNYNFVFNKHVAPNQKVDPAANPLMRESLDNPNYLSEQVNSNFHARTLHMLDKELVFSERLDNHFDKVFFDQNLERLLVDQDIKCTSEEDRLQIIERLSQPVIDIDTDLLPPMQGNVDYKKQVFLISVANLVLREEVKKLEEQGKKMIKQIENITGRDESYHYRKQYDLAGRATNFPSCLSGFHSLAQFQRQFQLPMLQQQMRMQEQNYQGPGRPPMIHQLMPAAQREFSIPDSYYDKKKRYRRTASEIERRFQCWCGKAYGSEGSLNQHRKLKTHY